MDEGSLLAPRYLSSPAQRRERARLRSVQVASNAAELVLKDEGVVGGAEIEGRGVGRSSLILFQ